MDGHELPAPFHCADAGSASGFDPERLSNYFQCYDIFLATGTNVITLHATDLAGNVAATNYSIIVVPGTNAPVITLNYPQNGMRICGSAFTVDGWLDNPTAGVMVTMVDTNGVTNSYNGLVERSGRFWVENLPLAAGTNELTLTATDTWSNSVSMNLAVVQSPVTFSVSPFDTSQLFQPTINLSGKVSDPGASITINGVTAVNSGGTWYATGVPTTDNGGGTVSFAVAMTDSQGNTDTVTTNTDKPDRLYVQSYSVSLSQAPYNRVDDFDNTEVPTDYAWSESLAATTSSWTWQDGAASSASGQLVLTANSYPTGGPYTNTCTSQESWPASWWPNLSSGSSTGTGSCESSGMPYTFVTGPPLIPWEQCNVTMSSNSGLYNSYYSSFAPTTTEALWGTADNSLQYSRHAQTKFNYYIGGKAVPGTLEFLVITASAIEITNLLAQPPYDSGMGPQVPYTSISVSSLGPVNSNWMVCVIAAAGSTVGVTPDVQQVQLAQLNLSGATFLPTHTTRYPALTDTNRARLNLGVGEYVDFGGMPAETTWTCSGGGLNTNTGSGVTFTAPSNATPSVTVTATYLGKSYPTVFDVVAPSGVTAIITNEDTFIGSSIPPVPGAGMYFLVTYTPTTVSFCNVQFAEMSEAPSIVTGLFTYLAPAYLYHQSAGWIPLSAGNQLSDHAKVTFGSMGTNQPPYPSGIVTWVIPDYWLVGNSSASNFLQNFNMTASVDANGNMTVTKFGQSVTNAPH